ncbi:MAG: class I SAM-dependent rRNA methyltransferase [Pirellulaceae bacterium]|nr:class I SAM-dependent rRNA methyltransferase [Pirellulaceae bacterium]
MNPPYSPVYIRAEKANVLASRHPWVWDRSIIEPAIHPEPGSIVDLMLIDGTWIGRGIYNPASHIRVRVYQWSSDAPLDEHWVQQQLALACGLRDLWQRKHGELDAVRLVNSEGDGLSGLVIERFGKFAVIQVTAAGVHRWLPAIARWLTQRYALEGVLLRIDDKIAEAEGMTSQRSLITGHAPEGPLVIQEYGVQLQLDLEAGQKTGYYLDQRTNRYLAGQYLGGRMLDVCTYLGGFALAACKHGDVEEVLAIDASTRALAQAAENAKLNNFEQIKFLQGDCFEELDRLRKENQTFDSIVLDPPRLAGSREHKSAALRAYHRLNLLAMQLLVPGGILVTCSCSGRVTREEFLGTLGACARRCGRAFQVIEQRGADFDHPFEVACQDSEYLKCIIGRLV